jgi:uncharacterized membrane protein
MLIVRERKYKHMKPKEIRDALLYEESEDVERRRKVVLLSVVGLADFSLIALLQSGVVRRLPDIPYPIFDTNGINTSKTSYAMGVPDAVVSSVMLAMKMALATAGGSKRANRRSVFDLLLGAVTVGHTLGAVQMTYDMLFKKKRICVYCLTGAGLIFATTAAIAPTVINSAKKALGLGGK